MRWFRLWEAFIHSCPGPVRFLRTAGGFQVFFPGKSSGKWTRTASSFQSHIDGEKIFLSPEKAVEVQTALGPDIMMCFDEYTTYPATREQTEKSMELTLRWAARCKKAHGDADYPTLFGHCPGRNLPRPQEALGRGDRGHGVSRDWPWADWPWANHCP